MNFLKILPVKFYVEAAEAQTWLNDKRPIVTSNEIGEDEDSTQMLQRKLDVFKCEIQTFETTIQHLKELVQNIGSDHFDSLNISSKMVSTFCNALKSLLFYIPHDEWVMQSMLIPSNLKCETLECLSDY